MHKKIKVVFIINNFLIGGVERLILDIISNFNKDKYDIQIVTVFGSGPLEADFRKLNIPIFFACPFKKYFKSLPFKLYWIVIAPITIFRIAFLFMKSKPDIVATSLFQADVIGMIAAKIIGVKKRIVIQHDIQKFGPLRNLIKKMLAFNLATNIISNSKTVKRFVVDYFKVNEQKITVIFNGVDFKKFNKRDIAKKSNNRITLGILGRLEKVKGHIYALEALKILKRNHNMVPKTLIAGDGSLREELENYSKSNNLQNIIFLGSVKNAEDFFSRIDILIVPSIEEGFGLVVLEGIVSRKVVIASDISAVSELITNGENGILFESQNSTSLANAIFSIIKNKEKYKEIQKQSSVFTEKKKDLLDISKVSKRYQEYILT